MITKKQTDPMEEAYKLISGDPSQTAVSDAAKGEPPLTDKQQRMRESSKTQDLCNDINEAYAMLFEGLAGIMRHK